MKEDEKAIQFILFTASFARNYVTGNYKLTEAKIKGYPGLIPKEYLRFIKNATVEHIIEVLSQYKDSQFYSRDIEVLLSPQGRKWLEDNIPVIKKVAEEMGIQ